MKDPETTQSYNFYYKTSILIVVVSDPDQDLRKEARSSHTSQKQPCGSIIWSHAKKAVFGRLHCYNTQPKVNRSQNLVRTMEDSYNQVTASNVSLHERQIFIEFASGYSGENERKCHA